MLGARKFPSQKSKILLNKYSWVIFWIFQSPKGLSHLSVLEGLTEAAVSWKTIFKRDLKEYRVKIEM